MAINSRSFRYLFVLLITALLTTLAHPAFAKVQKTYQGVPYISGSELDQQKLDIYTPEEKAGKLYPVLIFVHGGAWSIGDKSVVTPQIARTYTDQGIIVVSVNYRLSPKHKHPAHIKDLAAATKWIVDHIGEYGGNTKNMVLTGHSAGAHLIALLTTHPLYLSTHNLPMTVFSCVAPVDTASFNLTNPQEGKLSRMIQRMKDKAFGTDPRVLANASPTLLVKKGRSYPPFFLYVTAERPDAVRETRLFAQALNNNEAFARNIVIDEDLTHRDMGKAIFDSHSQIYSDIMGVFGKR